ncbi:MAG: hypothetical protein KKD05_10890 [Candidatus Omnitrophica bacterium]|nr:hypothetical protein [Candidatus Omnitrophota bacterium]
MLKKQKNNILILSHFIVFLLIQGLLVCPGFALNINISSQEHLSPRISISNSAFFDLIQTSYSDAAQTFSEISETNKLNLLDISYQKKQRVDLENQIIDNFKQNYPENQEQLELIKIFFIIADQQYGDLRFETGEFFYNHSLEFAAKASDNKAGFIEILAAIFHRMPTKNVKPIIKSLFENLKPKYGSKQARRMSRLFQKNELEEITNLTKKFLKIDKLGYHVSSQGSNTVENFMGAIINIMEGDFRIMRLLLSHKDATIEHASETRKIDIVKEIQNIYGPFAGRFGLFAEKKRLENDVFKIYNPDGYAGIMDKVFNTYGKKYEDLEDLLESAKGLIQKLADDYQIDAKISSRKKSPYRMYVKEKIKGKHKTPKNTLFGEDAIGLKVICETTKCFKEITDVIKSLKGSSLGAWEIAKIKPVSEGIIYATLKNGEGSLEVQFLTRKADNLRELKFAHWSYEIIRATNKKQKFDKVEEFGFYQLIEICQAAIADPDSLKFVDDPNIKAIIADPDIQAIINDPDSQEFDIDIIIEKYFKHVYELNKKWVYIFEKSEEIIDGVSRAVVKPKRLLRGANGLVFAAQTGVNLLGPDYAGITFYEWKGRELVAKKTQFNDLNPLRDGDIIEVKTASNYLLNKCNETRGYKDILSRSIEKDFLRAKVLLKYIGSLERIKFRDIQTAKDYLLLAFSAENITWGGSGENRFPDKTQYMQNFLNAFSAEKKLMTIEELYIALSLNVSELKANDVVDWAKKRGIVTLSEALDLDDAGIINKLKNTYGSLDQLYIEVGIGKISSSKVVNDLTSKQRVRISVSSIISGETGGTFSYKMTFGNKMNRKSVVAQIAKILSDNGINITTNFINKVLRNIKNRKNAFEITFEIPVKDVQLPKIRRLLIDKFGGNVIGRKVKANQDQQKYFITLGLIVKTPTNSSTSTLMRKIGSMQGIRFKDGTFNPATNETTCIICFDSRKLSPKEIENKLDLASSQNLRFVTPEEIVVIKALDKKNESAQVLMLMKSSI